MTASTSSAFRTGWRNPAASSDIEEDETDEELIAARAPRFNNNLGRAIEAALEKKISHPNQSNAGAAAAAAGAAGKRKKNKKTLLFASGMNLN